MRSSRYDLEYSYRSAALANYRYTCRRERDRNTMSPDSSFEEEEEEEAKAHEELAASAAPTLSLRYSHEFRIPIGRLTFLGAHY